MKITFREQGRALVILPEDPRLDSLVAQDFRAQVTARAAGRDLLVIDLSRVQFMDTSGLSGLISVMKRLPPGGQIRLAGPPDAVRALLHLTRLERVFPSYTDVAAAVAAG